MDLIENPFRSNVTPLVAIVMALPELTVKLVVR